MLDLQKQLSSSGYALLVIIVCACTCKDKEII